MTLWRIDGNLAKYILLSGLLLRFHGYRGFHVMGRREYHNLPSWFPWLVVIRIPPGHTDDDSNNNSSYYTQYDAENDKHPGFSLGGLRFSEVTSRVLVLGLKVE